MNQVTLSEYSTFITEEEMNKSDITLTDLETFEQRKNLSAGIKIDKNYVLIIEAKIYSKYRLSKKFGICKFQTRKEKSWLSVLSSTNPREEISLQLKLNPW